MHKIIKKLLIISSFIFIVFTLTSCIGIGPNEIILPKKKRIYKTFSETIGITIPKIDEVLDYYYGGDHLPPIDSTSCYTLRTVITLDEVPTDIDNMFGNEKMMMKYSSERFDDCERKGKFGKYVYFLNIISGIKEEYEEVLYNSSNFYWTFYYEKHHSNGDTIFFMGVYLPDYNYLYLFEREYHPRDFQFVEQN